MERIGKAIRTPSRDAMLSYASCEVGRGFTFGLHEALDQIGAILGPLFVAWVLADYGSYEKSFAYLLFPAIIALGILFTTRLVYPTPQRFEVLTPDLITSKGLSRTFKIYLITMGLVAAGYADFPLIAYHMEHNSVVLPKWIPIFYAVAMGVDAVAAIVLGKLFDRIGFAALFAPIALSMFFPIFVFSESFYGALFGMILWGIGMGSQESVMRAAVANIVSPDKRATAYGIFNAAFGACWFGGSALMGILYDISVPVLIVFSVAIQSFVLPMLWIFVRSRQSGTA
jgi:predicted MFS family arabinose efflux permease